MPDTTARIRAKGLDATGVTEELAERMFAHKGKHYMAIVELKVDEIHDKTDGKRRVDLILTQVEPTEDTRLDEHLRELTRTLDYNRRLDQGQLPLSDDTGPDPKIEDVLRDGEALVERDDDGNPVGLWPGDGEGGNDGAVDSAASDLAAAGDISVEDARETVASAVEQFDLREPAAKVFSMPFGDGQQDDTA